MRRGYKLKFREYIRYFILGVIVAALALGSMVTIKARHPDAQQCPDLIRECPNKMKPYEKDTPICPKIINPCPLEKSEQRITQ